jgi:hypothetical protein
VAAAAAAAGTGSAALELSRATCAVLAVELEHRRAYHSRRGTRRYYGKADVDCQLPDGRRALGGVSFGDCR